MRSSLLAATAECPSALQDSRFSCIMRVQKEPLFLTYSASNLMYCPTLYTVTIMKTISNSFETSDVRSELAAELANIMHLPASCFKHVGEPDGGQPSLAVEIGNYTHYIYHGFATQSDSKKQWHCSSYTTEDWEDADDDGLCGHTRLGSAIDSLEAADAIAFNHREDFFTDIVHTRATKA